jgi:hypothetical protein
MTKQDLERKTTALRYKLGLMYVNKEINIDGLRYIQKDAEKEENYELANAVKNLADEIMEGSFKLEL